MCVHLQSSMCVWICTCVHMNISIHPNFLFVFALQLIWSGGGEEVESGSWILPGLDWAHHWHHGPVWMIVVLCIYTCTVTWFCTVCHAQLLYCGSVECSPCGEYVCNVMEPINASVPEWYIDWWTTFLWWTMPPLLLPNDCSHPITRQWHALANYTLQIWTRGTML